MATRKLKVRMHPFELSHISYAVGPGFQVSCYGSLRYNSEYRVLGRNPLTFHVKKVKIESPYGFNGKANKLKDSKQAKYALQLLMETCPPCILVT